MVSALVDDKEYRGGRKDYRRLKAKVLAQTYICINLYFTNNVMAKKIEDDKPKKAAKKTTTRKKPGPKKGTPSNNPLGRPAGAKNKVSATVKARIAEYVNEDFDNYILEIESIKSLPDRVRAKTELIKLVVPKPVNEEETEATKDFYAEAFRRMFGAKNKEEDEEPQTAL